MIEGLEIKKKSKSLKELKNGDKIFVNEKEMIVDTNFVFMKHPNTTEMVIEFYNPENEREYQLRYFDDQEDTSVEIYELQGDFQYVRREPKTLSW